MTTTSEYWRTIPHIGHPLAQGLDFDMADGDTCSVTWDWDIIQYNIAVRPGSLRTELTAFSRYDVSNVVPWATLLGQPIVGVELYWSWVQEGGDGFKRLHYPQDLAVRFADSVVFLCCRKYLENSDVLFPMADAITVVFDEAAARRYGVGSFGDREVFR